MAADPSIVTKLPKNDETQQVFIGIFPESHIFVRDKLPDAEGRLPELAVQAQQNGTPEGTNSVPSSGLASPTGSFATFNTRETHDHDPGGSGYAPSITTLSRKSFHLPPSSHYQASSLRNAVTVYPASLRSPSPSIFPSQAEKPLPPRPSLKSGDETASGSSQPLIDEIASALREWHTLLFQYLARRDYKRFWIVTEHIEALHLGRRQLLAQTLSKDETTNLRKQCVIRLVRGNLVQGLDVIVRHPSRGGLVQADVEATDDKPWVSAVRMYAMQVGLAYVNVSYDDSPSMALVTAGGPADYLSAPVPTPAHSAFPMNIIPRHHHGRSQSSGFLGPSTPGHNAGGFTEEVELPTSAKFYHIFLDMRAFVASPCAPGETAELFFSLYQKNATQFVTEEFCATLNHNGVLARDPTARIRTLFSDLAQSDIQDPIYLVCRIVRNGALKHGTDSMRRGSEHSPLGPSLPTVVDGAYASPSSPQNTQTRPGVSGDNPAFARRPFGCAVLDITQLARMATDTSDTSPMREYSMPIFVPSNELLFATMHQHLINGNFKEFEKSTRYLLYESE